MKYHRFIGDFCFTGDNVKIFDKGLIEQIRKVLRSGIGDKIIFGDGACNEVLVEIEEMGKENLKAKVIETWENQNEPEKEVVLYCSILKRDNFELVIQKATEVGVKKIIPLISERTVKTGLRYDRLRKIIKEAAEQSGRGIIPVLEEVIGLEKAFKKLEKNGLSLFFDINGRHYKGDQVDDKRINIFIGPEGGWEEEEVKMAKNAGCQIVSLGKLTLRAETAAIVASYLGCCK